MKINDNPLLNDCLLPLEAVDITASLSKRPFRTPLFEIELAALKSLSRKLLEPKAELLQELTQVVLEVCQADSAGISILEKDGEEEVFRWHAVSGLLDKFIHETMPRYFSPCGIVVDRKSCLLLERPSRYWPYIEKLGMPLYEVLLIPFYREGHPVGTIWVVSHRPEKIFDLEDKRLLGSLADMAALIVENSSRFAQLSQDRTQLLSERDRARAERTLALTEWEQARRKQTVAEAERDRYVDLQRWFRGALDYLPKPIFFLDLETQKMGFTNKSAKRVLGLDEDEELETAVSSGRLIVSTPEGHPVSIDELPSRRVLRGETIQGEEFLFISSNGRYHVKVFAEQIPAVYGHPRTGAIIFQDITVLKETENELLKTQAELKEAVDVAHIGFWTLDIPTNMITITPLLMRQFGLDKSNYSGDLQETLDRVHTEDRARVTEAIQCAIDKHAPYHIEYRVVHQDGSIHWIQAKGAIINDSVGRPSRFAGTTIDVTEAIVARQEAEREREKAEVANIAKSQFLASMSHEIRSPFGAIIGFSELAQQPEATREEIDSYLRTIDRNSLQVLRIIDDILDLAKVESGRIDVEWMEFSLREFIADFSSFGFRAKENGISFVIKAQTDLPEMVCTDSTRLRQILTNALGNAIKFTSKGKVSLSIGYHQGLLEFNIEDTGRGISKDQAEGLFQPFVQADASTSRKYGGTGLGLVLTRRLCQLLGGDYVLVSSELGVGSFFKASVKVKLPQGSRMIPKQNVVFESFEVPPRVSLSAERVEIRVLLVEDSPDNQTLIRLILERQGVKVDVVSNAFAGMEKALNSDFDLVLMDIQMPHMDGHEAVQILRSKGYKKPIVALTAHAMKEEYERTRRSGFTAFLTKPIQSQLLIQKVKDLCENSSH